MAKQSAAADNAHLIGALIVPMAIIALAEVGRVARGISAGFVGFGIQPDVIDGLALCAMPRDLRIPHRHGV